MNPVSDWEFKRVMVRVVAAGASEMTIRFAAQLLGHGPCPRCDRHPRGCSCDSLDRWTALCPELAA